MKEKIFRFLFVLIGFSSFAQTKGVIVDENNQPISYVNIWVENENIGTTSEENGVFSINVTGNKILIFSALGYDKKTVKASEAEKVVLTINEIKIDEVVIVKKYETKEIEIGKVKNQTYQAFDNGPRIDVKFFPYSPSYKRTKYIKKLTLYTESRIENATVRIHFYDVDDNGFPNKELLKKDLIVTVRKGTVNHLIDVSDLNLSIPKKGATITAISMAATIADFPMVTNFFSLASMFNLVL